MDQNPTGIVHELLDEFDKLVLQKDGQAPIVQASVFSTQKDSAKNRLLKEASELERATNSSKVSDYDFNAELLDGKPKKKVYLKGGDSKADD